MLWDIGFRLGIANCHPDFMIGLRVFTQWLCIPRIWHPYILAPIWCLEKEAQQHMQMHCGTKSYQAAGTPRVSRVARLHSYCMIEYNYNQPISLSHWYWSFSNPRHYSQWTLLTTDLGFGFVGPSEASLSIIPGLLSRRVALSIQKRTGQGHGLNSHLIGGDPRSRIFCGSVKKVICG